MDIAEIKQKVITFRTLVLRLEKDYERARDAYNHALRDLELAVRMVEDYDFQQALTDGRTKKYKLGFSPVSLTHKQIKSIANKLGLELDIEED